MTDDIEIQPKVIPWWTRPDAQEIYQRWVEQNNRDKAYRQNPQLNFPNLRRHLLLKKGVKLADLLQMFG